MTNLLVIFGAGGHGKVVLDVARITRRFEDIVFFDHDPQRAGSTFCGCPLVCGPAELHRYAGSAFVIAVGDNHMRTRCFDRALQAGLSPKALVHPNAVIAPSVTIGLGTVVMAGAIVNADAVIGENCIINSGAIIEHDCQIGAHVHISPRVVLGGGVRVGQLAHVGIGAVVLPGAVIGEESVVGAGALVLKEAPARCTVLGVPAKTRSHG